MADKEKEATTMTTIADSIVERTTTAVAARMDAKLEEKIKGFATKEELHAELLAAKKATAEYFDPKNKEDVEQGLLKFYRGKFGEGKAWDALTTLQGLELIPSVATQRILKKAAELWPLPQMATKLPLDKGTIGLENTLGTAYRITTRGTPPSESAQAYSNVSFATVGLMAWIGLDNKLLREADMDVLAYLEDSLARAIVAVQWSEFVLGATGSGQWEGIRGAAYTNQAPAAHSTIATLDSAEMLALELALEDTYQMNEAEVAIFANKAFFAQAYALNAAGKIIYEPTTKQWFGHKAIKHSSIVSSGYAYPCAYLGNWKEGYTIFNKMGLVFKSTDVGKTATLADQTIVSVYTEDTARAGSATAIQTLTLHS
jgi:HK97 family phage major capsid protein